MKAHNLIKSLLPSACAALLCAVSVHAQGTLEDYNRAYALGKKYNYGRVANASPTANWLGASARFWWIDESGDARKYTLTDAATGKSSPLFDHHKFASLLAGKSGQEIKETDLHLDHLNVNERGDSLWFAYNGHNWVYAPRKHQLSDLGKVRPTAPAPHWMVVDPEQGTDPVVSPDGTKEAFIRESNVWVRNLADNSLTQLSHDGAPGNYYSSEIVWSPDSRRVASCRIRPAEKRFVYYVESSPADQIQPKLHKQEYAKPGDELRFKVPCIFEADGSKALAPDTRLFASQYDLYGPIWNADSEGITFEYNERGHKNYRILEMSASDGEVRPLVEESHDKYVNYSRIFRHYLADGKRIIWSSERDNYNHLYMYDRQTARPVCQITKGPWYVRRVINVDEEKGKIYFTANGVNQDEDPYFIRLYSVNFDGSGFIDLTPSRGTHRVSLSPDGSRVVDTYSTVADAPVTVIRDAVDGSVISTLAKADITPLTEAGWKAPEVFAAPGRDGKTMMWGLIYRPSNFDPAKKYPVVEYIYQGPGDQYVAKSFRAFDRNMSSLAELGFIVVMVDGMGTSFRSREFENVCHKNLVDAGLPDHIAWIKAAAEKYPYMDIDRVGIFGASAGGQESTTAVLHHPEFYKAAYSSCGCHDNRMDKIWWNEQWMGYPVDESYSKASNVDNAHLLTRPLMLVVGELDDNVDPASTMQVANALIKAGKDFELVVIPGAAHTMGESFGEHKRFDFFVRHLMGVTPPSWDEIEARSHKNR